jgi:hypothetical protein
MKKLRPLVEEYLQDLGLLKTVKLGSSGSRKKRVPTKADNDKLSAAISQAMRFNTGMIAATFSMLCVFVVAALFFAFYYRSNIGVSFAGDGVAFAASFGALALLLRLTAEITLMQVSLLVLNEMPPEQAANILGLLYWGHIRSVPKSLRVKQDINAVGEGITTIAAAEGINIETFSVVTERASDSHQRQ